MANTACTVVLVAALASAVVAAGSTINTSKCSSIVGMTELAQSMYGSTGITEKQVSLRYLQGGLSGDQSNFERHHVVAAAARGPPRQGLTRCRVV